MMTESYGGISDYKKVPREHHFSVYSDNGGSIVAVAGDDYAIIASDTRLSTGYTIYTREQTKLFPLSEKTILASAGCWGDVLALTRSVQLKMQAYYYEHNTVMPTPAVAQMLSISLYYKRFFPYYVSNILAGLDQNGEGVIYSYDPIGHFEKTKFRAGGSAGPLLQPLLDNQLGMKNQENVNQTFTLEKALSVLKDVFISAAERDIYTGDSITMNIITKDGVKQEVFTLRQD